MKVFYNYITAFLLCLIPAVVILVALSFGFDLMEKYDEAFGIGLILVAGLLTPRFLGWKSHLVQKHK